jgi:hypothetical protein
MFSVGHIRGPYWQKIPVLQAVERSLNDLHYCGKSFCCGTDSSYRYLIIQLMVLLLVF